VVEGARLERVYRGNSIEGSNPSLTATALSKFDIGARRPHLFFIGRDEIAPTA
jgi:hypothetical protein